MSTIPFEFGVVFITRYPFTDLLRDKQRPAVIVSSRTYGEQRADVIAMAITSQLRASEDFAETMIGAWAEAGLVKPSVIKPLLFTVEPSPNVRTLGVLAPADQSALRRNLGLMLG